MMRRHGLAGVAAVVVLALAAVASAESVQIALEDGIYKEQTAGDVDAAIAVYERIVSEARANRRYEAEAMYRLGACYLKKGEKGRAAETFRRLIVEFPKQRAVRVAADGELRNLAMPAMGRAPMVVKTTPAAFTQDVPATVDKILVTFDQEMMDASWSWTGAGVTFPKIVGESFFDPTRTRCALPVKLEPGKVYWVGINSVGIRNFKNRVGVPAPWYVVLFSTKGEDGAPTPIPEHLLDRAKNINGRARDQVTPAERRASKSLADAGWRLWRQRKLKQAEEQFARAVVKDPSHANAWNGLGWAQLNQGKRSAAKSAFERCVALDANNAAALNGLGWIAKGQGKSLEAIGYWDQAVKAQPTATVALSGLASTHIELKQYDKAVEYYETWLKVEPNSAAAQAGLKQAQAALRK